MANNQLISSATVLVLSLLLFSVATCGSTPSGPPANTFCPIDTLKLSVCADLLGLIHIGVPPSGSKCCALLNGLTDLEVAVCLCTAIKANVLGINLNVPIALSAVVTSCGKKIPTGFQCG